MAGAVGASAQPTSRVDAARSDTRLVQAAASASQTGASAAAQPGTRPPNIVLIVADDLGYGDIGANGAASIRTPAIDRLAAEGVRFTDFYVAQAVCSASRAAILTGTYPNRIGITGALDHASRIALAPAETTIAEVLKTRGYATAIYGKWHMGHLPPFLPTRQGFDDYYGLPYSNDMWPRHPERPQDYPDLPLIEGERVIATNPDQSQLTGEYTRRAVAFIEANKDRPFFLYLPHTMPHVPLAASSSFRGRSKAGFYGNVVEEIDDSVGRLLQALRRLSLDDRTLVVFTSDNGPWLSYGDHAGSAGPLREGKGTAWDGGTRVPFVARWPGHIASGTVVREPAMTIDLLPTFARIAGAELPALRIDGLDIGAILRGERGARSPHDALLFYYGAELRAVRSGRFKLVLPHKSQTLTGSPGSGGIPGKYKIVDVPQALYDLEADVAESRDVSAVHPDVVARLLAIAERAREDLGDRLTGRVGSGLREPGRVE
jgi:arylsulfatase A-like enzyme